ncbi:restriction endonuclease subunit S (plasmid) [Arthrobacter sp. TMP15]|uniref:restriction endonuclease subunit S n=1 Tax=Arthrobacter sp. TMP15 TaxID=3140789 RepID=UPI0031BA9549
MSRIDELIADHCPDGVKFFSIGDIAVTIAGLSGKTKADFTGGSARFVSYMNAFANLAVDQQAPDFVEVRPGERQNCLFEGDVVITGSSESLAEVGMSSVVTSGPIESLYLNSFCFAIRLNNPEILLPDFSKYLFRGEAIRKQIKGTANGVTRINISKGRFLKVRIPVPPIEVQREIVQILDQFTQLEAELEAELEARRRQYEHYRESLLATDSAKSRRMRLDELFNLRAGNFIAASKIFATSSDVHSIPCFGGGGLRGYVTEPNQRGDLVLIGRQGALCGNVKRASGEFYATEHSVVVTPLAGVDIRWAFHLLTSMNLNQYASKSAQPGLAVGTLNRLVVQVPSLDEQLRIGSILDKFDALVNDLSVGLPAELEARRKQYEYYRDRLLTFEEAVA